MATFEIDVVIARPVEEVFAYLANNENEVEWQAGLIESAVTSGGPIGVGATGRDVRRSMGMKVVNEWECTEFELNKSFSFNVTKPLTFSGSYVFEPTADGTRVSMSVAPSGLARVMWPVIAFVGRKQYSRDFAKLKSVLEAPPEAEQQTA